ncbi:hypothetical protein [Ferruginivarius sediminum]|uniref:DUF485 domain-containing protein n=1 Tax=Ferruginivarius sediminum TaxID=2661937 RepID=A0A369T6S1_9PROT|nr:hypothetical protein [Ferruginivarius sediminum]RDD61023.1 hypothetical protein DRB17_14955 [Ferruginivarius sediminum]
MNGADPTRIQRLFNQDKVLASTFVVLLWAAILYVFFTVSPLIEDATIRVVVAVAGSAVLLFNTAAIVAMLRHYSEDKEHIYGLDIEHLDALAEAKRTGQLQAAE